VGSVLVAVKLPSGKPFAAAVIIMLVFALIGLVISVLIPRAPIGTAQAAPAPSHGNVPTQIDDRA
jgi:hypothetical protein